MHAGYVIEYLACACTGHIIYANRVLFEASCIITVVLSSESSKDARETSKECPNCKQDIPMRCNKCKHCNVDLKKKRGHPVGTTKEAGYGISTNEGRPRKTTTNDGGSCAVSKQGGKFTKTSTVVKRSLVVMKLKG